MRTNLRHATYNYIQYIHAFISKQNLEEFSAQLVGFAPGCLATHFMQ